MNYNDLQDLLRAEKTKRRLHVVPDDPQKAELALQVLGHPGWQMYHTHICQLITTTTASLEDLKTQLLNGQQQAFVPAREALARLTTLVALRDYLPTLAKVNANATQ